MPINASLTARNIKPALSHDRARVVRASSTQTRARPMCSGANRSVRNCAKVTGGALGRQAIAAAQPAAAPRANLVFTRYG